MTIIKHGKFCSDRTNRIDLYGKCSRCECEFKTFVNIYWDAPETGSISFIPDQSCADMKIKPEFDYYDSEWIPGVFLTQSKIRTIRTITGVAPCPDCEDLTDLYSEKHISTIEWWADKAELTDVVDPENDDTNSDEV